MTSEEEEGANSGEFDYLDADNIRIKNTSLLEHFQSLHSLVDQIALLSCVQEIYEDMEAHLEQVREKERPLLEHALNVARMLKENQSDSN